MSDKSELWDGIGTMFIVLGFCLGVGSCHYIASEGNVAVIEAQAHLLEAQTAKIQAEKVVNSEEVSNHE